MDADRLDQLIASATEAGRMIGIRDALRACQAYARKEEAAGRLDRALGASDCVFSIGEIVRSTNAP